MDILLTGILAIAVFTDLLTYKIPNALIITGLVSSIFLQILLFEPPDLLKNLYAILIAFICTFILFLLKCLGAGDCKLFLIIASVKGTDIFIRILFLSLLISAAYGLIKKIFLTVKLHQKVLCKMHYSIAIFVAALPYTIFNLL